MRSLDPKDHKGELIWCTTIKAFELEEVGYTYRPGDAFMARVDPRGRIRQLVTREFVPTSCVRVFGLVGESRPKPEEAKPVLAVMVILRGKKAQRKFSDENIGRVFFKRAKERFGVDNTHLISLTKAIPPPEGFVPRKSQKRYWCPFCGDERRFKHNSRLDSDECPICGITDREFYVRKYNNLWPMSDDKKRTLRSREAEEPIPDGGEENSSAALSKAEKRKLRRLRRKERMNK